MLLSIVIVNYRTPELLRLFLKSLFSIYREKIIENEIEIIVVDSKTSRVTQDIVLDEFPLAKLLAFSENLGYPKGVNAGIKKAQGQYIFITQPDIIILPNSLEKLIEYLEQNSDVGIVGPKLMNFDNSRQDSCFRFYGLFTIVARRTFLGKLPCFKKTVNDFLMRDKDLSKTQRAGWLMGSALMTSKKSIEKIGLMDERFFMYFEDVDWCRRFWQTGLKVIYYPEATMYHYHQRESKSGLGMFDAILNRKTRQHIRSAIKYFFKWRKQGSVEI